MNKLNIHTFSILSNLSLLKFISLFSFAGKRLYNQKCRLNAYIMEMLVKNVCICAFFFLKWLPKSKNVWIAISKVNLEFNSRAICILAHFISSKSVRCILGPNHVTLH